MLSTSLQDRVSQRNIPPGGMRDLQGAVTKVYEDWAMKLMSMYPLIIDKAVLSHFYGLLIAAFFVLHMQGIV